MFNTTSSFISSWQRDAAWSNNDKASLTEPSLALHIWNRESFSNLIFSDSQILLKWVLKVSMSTLWRSNLWHLDIIVAGIFFISVVAKINLTFYGGSSNVFNKALNAALDNMWTSSIM